MLTAELNRHLRRHAHHVTSYQLSVPTAYLNGHPVRLRFVINDSNLHSFLFPERR